MAVPPEILAQLDEPAPQPTVQTNSVSAVAEPPSKNIPPELLRQLDAPSSMAPLTNQALLSSTFDSSNINRPPLSAIPERIKPKVETTISSGTGQEVPLDIDNGLPLARYFRLAWQRRPEEREMLLKQLYPDTKVGRLENGEMTVRIKDSATGQPKDVMLNPAGLNAHDLIDLSTQLPEAAATMATFLLTGGASGALAMAAQMVVATAAGQYVGVVKDVAARKAEGLPIQPEEIFKSRTIQGAQELFFQGALGAAGKLTRILSPFARGERLAFDQAGARRFFKENWGIDVEQTPAELTGAPMLQKIEAFESQQPGASTIMGRLRERANQAIMNIKKIAIGTSIPEEEIGQSSIDLLKQKVTSPIERALTQTKADLQAAGETRVASILDDITGVSGPRMTGGESGRLLRSAYNQKLEVAHSRVDKAYDLVRQFEAGKEKMIPADDVANAALKVFEEIPKVTKVEPTQTASHILDEFGRPTIKSGEEKTSKLLESAIPTSLKQTLNDMLAQKGQLMSLDELTKLKQAAYDEISKTEAVPGVKDRWFNMVAKGYEDAINQGIEKVGDPGLKSALKSARETYKKELLPFERPGLTDISRTEFEPGFKSDEELIDRLFSGGKAEHNYQLIKDTLGANHPALGAINRSVFDTYVAKAKDALTGKVNVDSLLSDIKSMDVNHPDIAAEIFKGRARDLTEALRTMKAGQALHEIPEDELRLLMDPKNPLSKQLELVAAAEEAKSKAYSNEIIRDVGSGTLIAPKIRPTEFVNRLISAKTSTPDLKLVLNTIESQDPAIRNAISNATIKRILDDATRLKPGKTPTLSSSKIKEMVAGDDGERLKLLLGERPLAVLGTGAPGVPPVAGPDRVKVIDELVKLVEPKEIQETLFKTSGQLAGGTQITRLITAPLQYATEFTRKLILATAYTSKGGTALIGNRMFDAETSSALANALIASEPFIRLSIDTFGEDTTSKAIVDAKRSIDRYAAEAVSSVKSMVTEKPKK